MDTYLKLISHCEEQSDVAISLNLKARLLHFVGNDKLRCRTHYLCESQYQLPNTDYRSLITEHRLPITDYRLLITSLFLVLSLASYHLPLTAASPGDFFADGNKNKKAVALTFDDGPGKFTLQVLELLDQYQIKATFFMNGNQVELRPQIAKEVTKRGHEIADHTYSHINFYAYEKKYGIEKTKEKIQEEMKKSKEIIHRATGILPKLCRLPHGYHKPWLKEIAKEFEYVLVNWTFGEDWQPVSEEIMTGNYIRHLRPGAILLLHDGGKNREKTIRALPKIIEEGKRKGFAFSTVSEIIQ